MKFEHTFNELKALILHTLHGEIQILTKGAYVCQKSKKNIRIIR